MINHSMNIILIDRRGEVVLRKPSTILFPVGTVMTFMDTTYVVNQINVCLDDNRIGIVCNERE